MPKLDHHREAYDDETLDKLELYEKYLQYWLPVFLNDTKLGITRIQIFDFFAGPGQDVGGVKGSPLRALDAINEALEREHKNEPEIHVFLNELDNCKSLELKNLCSQHPVCKRVKVHYLNEYCATAFDKWLPYLYYEETGRKVAANLIFLDQSGTKEVNEQIFKSIVAAPRTDFMFFIASSYVLRFRGQNLSGTPLKESDLANISMKTCHRMVCDAYRRWLPSNNTEYYLAPFSLEKDNGANVYGLIFGTAHIAGIDKFLTISWAKDSLRGEANYDIDGENIDIDKPLLFAEWNIPSKITVFEKELEKKILNGDLTTNIAIYKYAIKQGFLAEHAKTAVKKLISEKKLPVQKVNISYSSCGHISSKPTQIILPGASK